MKSYQRLLKHAHTVLCQTGVDITTALEQAQDALQIGDEPLSDAFVKIQQAARSLSGNRRVCFMRFAHENPKEVKQLFMRH